MTLSFHAWTLPATATAIACAGAAAGVFATSQGRFARFIVPLSGGILVGVAAMGLFPEIARITGWSLCLALFVAGYLTLYLLDRLGYPICPSCSHSHEHEGCATTLHGFTAPIVIATSLHAFLAGWSVATAAFVASSGLRLAVPLAILLHKAPEGLALGSILKASMPSAGRALLWAILAELCTLIGAGVGLAMGATDSAWLSYALAVAGGFFIYLGLHAIHGEWRKRGAGSAAIAGLGGAAAAVALQFGARVLWSF